LLPGACPLTLCRFVADETVYINQLPPFLITTGPRRCRV
jgi:hypothetical protein